METVTAGNEVAIQAVRFARLGIGHVRAAGLQVVQHNALGLLHDLAGSFLTSGIQVFGDLCLAVRHHRFARVTMSVDQKGFVSGPLDANPVMDVTFPVHPRSETVLPQ